MYNSKQIQGAWPNHPRMVMSACDSRYFDWFADRFVTSFRQSFALPVHLHLIAPTDAQREHCDRLSITHTHEYPSQQDMHKRIQWCVQQLGHTPEMAIDNVVAGYSQAVRFWLLGRYQTSQQSVIMADIDCAAVQIPTPAQLDLLCSATQFSLHNGRTMATFCAFAGQDLAQTQTLSRWIEQYDQERSVHNGVDQLALKKCIVNPVQLPAGWISHEDTPTDKSVKHKATHNIVFHSKGTRGKSIDLSPYL